MGDKWPSKPTLFLFVFRSATPPPMSPLYVGKQCPTCLLHNMSQQVQQHYSQSAFQFVGACLRKGEVDCRHRAPRTCRTNLLRFIATQFIHQLVHFLIKKKKKRKSELWSAIAKNKSETGNRRFKKSVLLVNLVLKKKKKRNKIQQETNKKKQNSTSYSSCLPNYFTNPTASHTVNNHNNHGLKVILNLFDHNSGFFSFFWQGEGVLLKKKTPLFKEKFLHDLCTGLWLVSNVLAIFCCN